MGKVVLVTGGSRGIGEATVRLFASYGYDVVINYYSGEDRAINIAREIEGEYGVRTLCLKADVSVEEEVKVMVDKIINKFGKIDVLVNNAGIAIDTDFSVKSVSNFRRIIDINLIGTFLVSKYVSKDMLKHGGAIVNVGSTNGIDSYYTYSMDYDASKAGVHILTKNLAIEFAPNIRVNAVAPGWIMTPMNEELDDDFMKEEKKRIILDRFGEPIEVAKVIYFLASEGASYVNGTVVVVDGGRK
ncbi:MAG: SDR family oxidoreductase [Bacilli bacterium]|nr:SDR family oxidoreductase [Bacilli bacterium]